MLYYEFTTWISLKLNISLFPNRYIWQISIKLIYPIIHFQLNSKLNTIVVYNLHTGRTPGSIKQNAEHMHKSWDIVYTICALVWNYPRVVEILFRNWFILWKFTVDMKDHTFLNRIIRGVSIEIVISFWRYDIDKMHSLLVSIFRSWPKCLSKSIWTLPKGVHAAAGFPLAQFYLVLLWANWDYITRAQSKNCKNKAFVPAGVVLTT